MGKDNVLVIGIGLFPLLFFAAFFALPLAAVFSTALAGFDANAFIAKVFGSSGLLWNSFSQAAVSTFFSVVVGVPAAFLLAKRDFPFKGAFRAFSMVPFVFPSILVVLSFVMVFGNNGWANLALKNFFGVREPLNFIYGFSGIILAHVFYNFPIVMRFVSDAWQGLGSSAEEAAMTLGAKPLDIFLRVELPRLWPSILASASIVFIYCFMSFAIVLSFGGVSFPTFETEIYYQISRKLDFGFGAMLALLQFAALAFVAFVFFVVSKKFSFGKASFMHKAKGISLGSISGIAEAAFAFALFAFVALPLLSIAVFAFTEPSTGQFSLRAFAKIFSSGQSILGTTPLHSIAFSLFIAATASFTATLIAFCAAIRPIGRGIFTWLLGASIAVSVITLGLGYFVTFGSGNLFVIAMGHAVLAFPFAYRIISGSLSTISSNVIDSARSLGASWIDLLLRVKLPLAKKAVFASFAFSFAVSLGELGLVLLLYDGVYPTMPVYIYRLLSSFDLFAACAMGLVLLSASFLCFYAIERFSESAGATRVL